MGRLRSGPEDEAPSRCSAHRVSRACPSSSRYSWLSSQAASSAALPTSACSRLSRQWLRARRVRALSPTAASCGTACPQAAKAPTAPGSFIVEVDVQLPQGGAVGQGVQQTVDHQRLQVTIEQLVDQPGAALALAAARGQMTHQGRAVAEAHTACREASAEAGQAQLDQLAQQLV